MDSRGGGRPRTSTRRLSPCVSLPHSVLRVTPAEGDTRKAAVPEWGHTQQNKCSDLLEDTENK